MRLKFYLTLAGFVLFSILTGVFFSYLVWLGWKMQLNFVSIKYEYFMAMAVILFIMFVSDIVLFFRLILRRQYW